MRTVLIANRKGGVGKTMIAVTLASALANRGERVGLADADRQQSSRAWLGRRPPTVPQIRALNWTKAREIGDAPKKLDWLIIDAPGALKGAKAEALISEAKAILTPVQPSVFDETSTSGFLDDIEHVKRVRKGKVGVHVIANRIRPRSRAADTLFSFLEDLGYTPMATLSERAVYGDLAAMGMAIFDRETASLKPIKAQWEPILKTIKG
ncbi:MAG: ParA family protein [Pseudomonadota bacterium]